MQGPSRWKDDKMVKPTDKRIKLEQGDKKKFNTSNYIKLESTPSSESTTSTSSDDSADFQGKLLFDFLSF